jgi:hypothetical protein
MRNKENLNKKKKNLKEGKKEQTVYTTYGCHNKKRTAS